MDYKIAIIGSPQAIQGFKALGVVAFPVGSAEEGEAALKEVAEGKFAVLLVTEDWAGELSKSLQELQQQPLPAVTVLPSQSGSTGSGDRALGKIVERAVGSDILSKS